MNSIATTGSNAIAALSSLKQGLQNVATSIVSTGGDPFLRLLKDGSWVYGADNVQVEDGTAWAVNPLSLMHGWVAWSDYKKKTNEVVGEVMVPAGQALPLRSSLQDVTDDEGNKCDWSQQLSLQFQCMEGEDVGTQVLYKVTSVGGMNATKGLVNAISAQLETDIENPVPSVELHCDFYMHKKYGKTYVPEFKIVEWGPLDDTIKAPMKADTPDSDTTAATAPAEAQRVRTRGAAAAPADDNLTRAYTREELDAAAKITPEDRRAAIDAAMADKATARSTARAEAAAAAPAEEAAPRRRQRR